jgi:hypothetical protein
MARIKKMTPRSTALQTIINARQWQIGVSRAKIKNGLAPAVLTLVLMASIVSAAKIGELQGNTKIVEPIQINGVTSFSTQMYPGETTFMQFNISNTAPENIGKPPYVLLTFDDSWRPTWFNAKPIMDEYGYKGITFFPTGWVTYDVLENFSLAGWEIGCHTATHPFLNMVSNDTLYLEIIQPKLDMEANVPDIGRVAMFAAPYSAGIDNATVMAVVNKAYLHVRPVGPSLASCGFGEPCAENALAVLNYAKSSGQNVWIMFHGIGDGPEYPDALPTATFRAVLDVVNSSGLTVATWKAIEMNGYDVTVSASISKPEGVTVTGVFGSDAIDEESLVAGYTRPIVNGDSLPCTIQVASAENALPGNVTIAVTVER